MAITMAERVAAKLGNDGQNWDGFESLVKDADVEYAREYIDDDGNRAYERTDRSSHFAGYPVRYVFDDGSAIVEAGDAWDIEGDAPFTWQGSK